MNPKIIGVCGISGSGKTTLARALAHALHDSSIIFWDDFEAISEYPPDYIEWYRNSKDYAAWKTPALAQTLESLKMGTTITCPATNKILEPTKWIIYDAPLGRNHLETGQHIDYLVFLDIPADIALVRRLKRDYLSKSSIEQQEIQQELDTYIHSARPLFLDVASLKAGADLIVHSELPLHQLVEQIISSITQDDPSNHFPQANAGPISKHPVISRTGVYGFAYREEKLLIIKQRKGPHQGKYDLPGGGIEPGETIEEALRREFLEEVGMTFNTMHLLNNFSVKTETQKDDGSSYCFHQLGLIYQVDHPLSLPNTSPEMEFCWIPVNQLSEMSVAPLLFQALHHLRAHSNRQSYES